MEFVSDSQDFQSVDTCSLHFSSVSCKHERV